MNIRKDTLEEIIERAAKEEITRQALKLIALAFGGCEEEEAEQSRKLARLAVLYHEVSNQDEVDDTTDFYMAYKQRAGEFLERFTEEEFFNR